VRSGQHLDQGRLPRTVLAEQAVDLARRDVEVHTVQCPDAGELLDDIPHREQQRCHGGKIGALTSAVQRANNAFSRYFSDDIEP
jgi:hypothetical protein